MLEGPIGGAAFNNEFGRPNLTGYFRTYEQDALSANGIERRGYHKPIMIAGGYGNIRAQHVQKGEIPVGGKLIVMGGPAMLIGLGGGAASSMASGESSADLDFASVQRENPEIERRAQEVIDRCWAMGEKTPFASSTTWVPVASPMRCRSWSRTVTVAGCSTCAPCPTPSRA